MTYFLAKMVEQKNDLADHLQLKVRSLKRLLKSDKLRPEQRLRYSENPPHHQLIEYDYIRTFTNLFNRY